MNGILRFFANQGLRNFLGKELNSMEIENKLAAWSHQRQKLGMKGETLIGVIRSIGGVYSWHPSACLSLRARVSNFNKEEFFELDKGRKVLRVPGMRGSVHLIESSIALQTMTAILPPADDPSWEKRYSQAGRKVLPEKYKDWQKELLDLLKRPMPVKDIKQTTSIPAEKVKPVLNRMAYERKLLRVGAPSLTSNLIRYVSWQRWMPQVAVVTREESLVALAKTYLKAFGPARLKDFKWWAGISTGEAKAAFAKLALDELDNGLTILMEDSKGFEQFVPQQSGVIDLLPQWDSYTMGYAPDGRKRLVDPQFQDFVYGKLGATLGNGLGTISRDGMAIGSWHSRVRGKKLEAEIHFFKKENKSTVKEVDKQLREIARLFEVQKA